MNNVNIWECGTAHADTTAICCSALTKSYGKRRVLVDVDLELEYGSILALLGRNGAGKSTLISTMCGLTAPDSGRLRVAGFDLSASNTAARPRGLGAAIGLAPQDLGLYPQLTVLQNLTSFGIIQGLSSKEARLRARQVIAVFGLDAQSDQHADSLSGGQKRRLHTAIALVHHPSVLFLDEPTVGADVEARSSILAVVRNIANEGTAVIYTTHYMEEVEQLGAEIAFLDDGRIIDRGSMHDIIDRHAAPSVQVTFETDDAQPDIPGWRHVDDHIEPDCPIDDPGQALAMLLAKPQCRNRRLKDVRVIHANLETAYRNVVVSTSTMTTGGTIAPSGAATSTNQEV